LGERRCGLAALGAVSRAYAAPPGYELATGVPA